MLKAIGSVRNAARAAAIVLIPLLLAACGGGGGGGGGSGGGGAPTTPPTPPPVLLGREFPALIEVSEVENNAGQGFNATRTVKTFQFYAPTDELPSAITLTGPDATWFTVTIAASNPPNSEGMRDITVTLRYLRSFNFENPEDADKNNVYEFTAGAAYRGTALTTNFKVSITDQDDPAEAGARYVFGAATNQEFGQVLSAIPDITGDGRSELGVSVQTGIGPATGYILPGEYLSGLKTLTTDIATLGAGGTRLMDKSVSAAAELNRVSASETRGGVSVLVSDAGDNKFYLFQAMTPDEYLRGDLDPAMSTNRITYEGSAAAPLEGRMLGDANGDGVADIFIQTALRQEHRGFGVIFGRSPFSQADRTRPAEPDTGFVYTFPGDPAPVPPVSVDPRQSRIEAKLVPDVDGDGYKDLIVMSPDYASDKPSERDRGAMWLIRSWVLRGPTQIVDLDTMGPALGFRMTGRRVSAVTDTADFDGDGFRTLLFATDDGSTYAIDGNDFNDLEPSTLPPVPPTGEPPAAFGPKSVKIQNGGGAMSSAGDLDGDGLEDFIGGRGSFFNVTRGSYLKKQLADFSYAPVAADVFQVQLYNPLIYFANLSRAPVLALPDNDLIAAPAYPDPQYANSQANPEYAGRVILIKLSDVRAAMAKGGSLLWVYLR